MKTKPLLLLMGLIVCFSLQIQAQDTSTANNSATSEPGIDKNLIKLNITALFFKNIALQYERVINKPISAFFTVRMMPKGTLPYHNMIYNRWGEDDTDAEEIINNMKMGIISVTPGVKFYPGKKGYGEGFYIAPLYSWSKSNVSNIIYNYENDNDEENSITLSGELKANQGGFLLGYQWILGKRFCLDWWFFGPVFGKEKGNLTGLSTEPLSPEDQADLKENFEDVDIPNTTITADVNEYGATVTTDGILGGFKFGLSFGIKF